MKHRLNKLGWLMVLGVMVAIVMVPATNSGQVSGGTFDKKARAAGTVVASWPD
jgi:hypothetical protein